MGKAVHPEDHARHPGRTLNVSALAAVFVTVAVAAISVGMFLRLCSRAPRTTS